MYSEKETNETETKVDSKFKTCIDQLNYEYAHPEEFNSDAESAASKADSEQTRRDRSDAQRVQRAAPKGQAQVLHGVAGTGANRVADATERCVRGGTVKESIDEDDDAKLGIATGGASEATFGANASKVQRCEQLSDVMYAARRAARRAAYIAEDPETIYIKNRRDRQ